MLMVTAVTPKSLMLHKIYICIFLLFFIDDTSRFGAALFFRTLNKRLCLTGNAEGGG
jgi:hypothetical protein